MNTRRVFFGAKEVLIIVFSFLFLFVITDYIATGLRKRGHTSGRPAFVYRYEFPPTETKDMTIFKESYCDGEQIIVDHHSSIVSGELLEEEIKVPPQAMMISIVARTVKPHPCVRVAPYRLEEPFTVSGIMPMVVYLSVESGLMVE